VKRVVWTRQAVEDVEAIKAYVSRDSAHYAAFLIERIIGSVDRLDAFPESGRVVPEVGDGSLREVIFGAYRIVYRAHRESVEVLTVHHAARLLRP
jgi:addiction module RelE/StbE family toxin